MGLIRLKDELIINIPTCLSLSLFEVLKTRLKTYNSKGFFCFFKFSPDYPLTPLQEKLTWLAFYSYISFNFYMRKALGETCLSLSLFEVLKTRLKTYNSKDFSVSLNSLLTTP